MTRAGLTDRICYAERDLNWLRSLVPNCLNCDDHKDGYCKRFSASPPADFLQQGCEHWNFDDVPF
jgi:hypothetical protein